MNILKHALIPLLFIILLFTLSACNSSGDSEDYTGDNTDYLELKVTVIYDDAVSDTIDFGDVDPEDGKAGTKLLYVFLYNAENYSETSPFRNPRSPYPTYENYTSGNGGTVLFDSRGEVWYEILEEGEYYVMALYDYRSGSFIMNRSDPYALYVDNETVTNDPSEAVPVSITKDTEITITFSGIYQIQEHAEFDL